MGLFSRNRSAAPQWRPVIGASVDVTGYEADMNDEGQVPDRAYLVMFGMVHPDGAVITIWTYASYTGDGRYCVRLRYRYTSEAHPDWSFTGHAGDPLEETYPDPATAEYEAAAWSDSLASGSQPTMANLPEVFDWDGQPFSAAPAEVI
jgi:hypothetical protein